MSHLKPSSDVVIRSTYSPKLDVSLGDFGPTLTQQSFREECDIDAILKRYAKTGVFEHVNQHHGNYGEFLNVQDYHTSVNQVMAAQEMFMSLPAQIRSRFQNDPAQFLSFAADSNNRKEMASMGLLKPEAVQKMNDLKNPPKASEGGPDGTSGGL